MKVSKVNNKVLIDYALMGNSKICEDFIKNHVFEQFAHGTRYEKLSSCGKYKFIVGRSDFLGDEPTWFIKASHVKNKNRNKNKNKN